jgi:hypothetical protein
MPAKTVLAALLLALQPMIQTPPDPLKDVAERYVKLVLAVGLHDSDYVDAYYGPAEWRSQLQKFKVQSSKFKVSFEVLELISAKLCSWSEVK